MIDDNTLQTTNTHNLGGFQYTEDHLDFFPHAEGYVNVLEFSEFHYVYTYKDHLGNIRLKYTQDPGTGQTEILEENHYYPFGLTHKGYNGEHRFFFQTPGTGIQLVPVTPVEGDKHKYKFGGMEFQDELDLNHYDFGARNYDPALGRWMNVDPLAEYAYTYSPYSYAFNNPIYYIDPDGQMNFPFGDRGSEAFETMGFGLDYGFLNGGGKESDPQYPNTSGRQQLPEVNLGVVKKKDTNTDYDEGRHKVHGKGTEDLGEKEWAK